MWLWIEIVAQEVSGCSGYILVAKEVSGCYGSHWLLRKSSVAKEVIGC